MAEDAELLEAWRHGDGAAGSELFERHYPAIVRFFANKVVPELFYWEGMTSAAIAEVLDTPHGTIRTRLRRARALLEDALAGLHADPGLLQRTLSDLDGWASQIRQAHASPVATGSP